jgi:RHS repeat-associated protein
MLMNNIARILLAVVAAVVIISPLAAEEPGQQRYIVVVRQQRFGPPPAPDIARLGGTIESRQDDQLVVTIPAGALATLKSDPAVLYLERVGGTADDESPLIGEPVDPQPGAQSKHLTPHALGAISWDSGTYAYDGAGNIVSIGTDKYLYDGVQRLKQSSTQGSIETYTYDGFGNMKTRTNVTLPSIDSATNRYMGYNYNQIGAVTSDGSYTFTYDALGQPLRKVYNNQSNTVEDYVYTPGDERIGVQRGGWWTWSVRDEGGKVLRQYKSSATNLTDPALWLEDFVWRDGLLLGSQRPVEMGGRRHFHLDHLGTARLITSDSGQMVSYHDYYPFGDEYSPVMQESSSGFGREEPLKFTGHERDYAGGMGAEDGHALDYMHARFYSSTAGRFLSPDQGRPTRPEIHLPQRWNRYTYAQNSPIQRVDPDGMKDTIYLLSTMGFWDSSISQKQIRRIERETGKHVQAVWHATKADITATAAKVDNTGTDLFVVAGHTIDNGKPGAHELLATWQPYSWGTMSATELAGALNGTTPYAVMLLSCSSAGMANDLAILLGLPVIGADSDFNELTGMSEADSMIIDYLKYDRVYSFEDTQMLIFEGRAKYQSSNDPNDPFRGSGFCDASNVCH